MIRGRIFGNADPEIMHELKSVALSAEIDTQTELKPAFYKITNVRSELLHDLSIRITFELSSCDTKWFTASTVKKVLSKYGKVKQSRFRHPRLTSGYTEFTYDIKCNFVAEYE